jgi:hypothetical protein
MAVAGGQVVASAFEGIDRTSGQAGSGAGVAWSRRRRGQINLKWECQRAAKADHQALSAVHKEPDRAFPDLARAQRPTEKRMVWLAAKGKKRCGPEICGYVFQHPLRPAIHWVWPGAFGLAEHMRPIARLSWPDQHQAAAAWGQCGVILAGKPADHLEMVPRHPPLQRV